MSPEFPLFQPKYAKLKTRTRTGFSLGFRVLKIASVSRVSGFRVTRLPHPNSNQRVSSAKKTNVSTTTALCHVQIVIAWSMLLPSAVPHPKSQWTLSKSNSAAQQLGVNISLEKFYLPDADRKWTKLFCLTFFDC